MNKIILASRSPRRVELLATAGFEFECEPSDIEEVMDTSLPLEDRMQKLAYDKALPIAKKHPDCIVIGADTIVCIDDEVIGKAKDKEEAKAMLQKFSGKTQSVYTGVCVFKEGRSISFTSRSDVVFYPLSEKDIEDYLSDDEWMGKAGAYAIQGKGSLLVKEIHGDYANIVGLPIAKLARILRNF